MKHVAAGATQTLGDATVITAARLRLRDYVPGDLPALVAYQGDPGMREFYGPGEGSPEQMSRLLDTFMSWASEAPRRNWQLAIVLRERPHLVVGSCGLRQVDGRRDHAEFGIDLSPSLWGSGYATEAAIAMLDFAFGTLGIGVVRGETVSANVRVAALLIRLGFRGTGSTPGPEWMEKRGWTHINWELRREEWRRTF